MTYNSYAIGSAGGYLYSPGGLSARPQTGQGHYQPGSRAAPAVLSAGGLRYLSRWDYSVPAPTDSLDDLLVGKAAFLGKRLEQIQSDIDTREHLLKDNLYQLELEICHADSRIDHLLQLSEWGEAHTLAQKKTSLYNRLAELEREKRSERVACWADTCRMKKDLFEVAEQYKQAKRREGLWGDLSGAD